MQIKGNGKRIATWFLRSTTIPRTIMLVYAVLRIALEQIRHNAAICTNLTKIESAGTFIIQPIAAGIMR